MSSDRIVLKSDARGNMPRLLLVTKDGRLLSPDARVRLRDSWKHYIQNPGSVCVFEAAALYVFQLIDGRWVPLVPECPCDGHERPQAEEPGPQGPEGRRAILSDWLDGRLDLDD